MEQLNHLRLRIGQNHLNTQELQTHWNRNQHHQSIIQLPPCLKAPALSPGYQDNEPEEP